MTTMQIVAIILASLPYYRQRRTYLGGYEQKGTTEGLSSIMGGSNSDSFWDATKPKARRASWPLLPRSAWA